LTVSEQSIDDWLMKAPKNPPASAVGYKGMKIARKWVLLLVQLTERAFEIRVCPEITSEFLSNPTGQTLSIIELKCRQNSELKKRTMS
jgi:hypothetical protein